MAGKTFRGLAALAIAAVLCCPGAATSADTKPKRVVSLNLCLDQLVVLLAERRNIASISFLGADPGLSPVADRVGGIRLNHGLAEEILPLDPDLVLAGKYGAREAVSLLRRLGYRVVEIENATRLDQIPDLIRRVAALIGEQDNGRRLAARFEARLSQAANPVASGRPLAVIYNPNGYTAGVGSLENAVVEAAGFDSLARRLGIAGTAVIPLETLLMAKPDILITGRRSADAPALATELLKHPALKHVFRQARTVVIPDSLWICGGPAAADAMERLAAARRVLARDRP